LTYGVAVSEKVLVAVDWDETVVELAKRGVKSRAARGTSGSGRGAAVGKASAGRGAAAARASIVGVC
jgi:hypothetical protein